MTLLPILTDPLITLPIAYKTFLPVYSSFSERFEAQSQIFYIVSFQTYLRKFIIIFIIMTDVETILQQTLQSQNINQVSTNIAQLAQLNNVQIQANQMALQRAIPLLTKKINKQIQTQSRQIQNPNQLSNNIKNLYNILPTQIKKQNTNFLKLTNQLRKAKIKDVAEQFRMQAVNQIQNQIFKDALKQNDISNIQFGVDSINNNDLNQTAIQRSVKPYAQMLNTKLNVIQQNKLPDSVRFLGQYAKMDNLTAFGSISQSQGVCFVGVKNEQVGQQQFYTTKKYDITYVNKSSPNIRNQLQFHTEKTINSWNNFVADEAKLVTFVNKITNYKSRIEYVESQLKGLTLQTFAAKYLATIVYYYVYLPLQLFYKQASTYGYQLTQQKFSSVYKIPPYVQSNPLILNSDQGKQLMNMLLNVDDKQKDITKYVECSELANKVITKLKEYQIQINKKHIQYANGYIQRAKLQAITYFNSSSIPKQIYDTMLGSKKLGNIKKRKILTINSLIDSQVVQMIKKNLKDEQKLDVKWNMNWYSQWCYCNDYIWGKNNISI